MPYYITEEGSTHLLKEVETLKEASEFIKNQIIEDLELVSPFLTDEDQEAVDDMHAQGMPWSLYVDEGVCCRYKIYRDPPK